MPLPPLRNPRRPVLLIWGTIRGMVIGSVLFVALLGFNLLQMSSMLVWPFSAATFRRINRFAANTWWGWCTVVLERVYGLKMQVTGDDIPMRENAVVIANHQQMTDINLLLAFARTKDRLGDLKWFVKDPIKFVPGVGWGMVFLGCLFVKRNWAADRKSIRKTFAHLTDNKIPTWLVVFPEGTRFSLPKLERSHIYAFKHGLHAPEHTVLPRVKGFTASVHGLRQYADAVYDITIIYRNGVPTLWQYVRGFVDSAEMHIRRYPISELPEDDDALARWLYERFADKDRLLGQTYPSLESATADTADRSRHSVSLGVGQPDSP